MSESKKPKVTTPKAAGVKRSGEHPAVQTFRKKMDSIETSTLAELQKMNKDIERLGASLPATPSSRKPKVPRPDPRRERPSTRDLRREDEETDPAIPVDVVDLHDAADTLEVTVPDFRPDKNKERR